MARFSFDARIRDDKSGFWLYDIEVEVEIVHERGQGLTVDGIFVLNEDGEEFNLYHGDKSTVVLAGMIEQLVLDKLGRHNDFNTRVEEHFAEEYAEESYDRAASAADRRNDLMREGAL